MESPLLKLPNEIILLIADLLVSQPKLGAAHNFTRLTTPSIDQISQPPLPHTPATYKQKPENKIPSIAAQALAQFISDRDLALQNQKSPSCNNPKDSLLSFDGYTTPRDLINLSTTCHQLRNVIGARLWHSIIVGDSSRTLPHRSPLVRSSQVPGFFQYSFENELSVAILSHVVHLQLNTETKCTVVNGPYYSHDTPEWVRLLDPRVSPNLESVSLVVQNNFLSKRYSIQHLRDASHKAAAYLSAHNKPTKVSLVTNTPIELFDIAFLDFVESAEWTLTESFTDLSKISHVSSLSLTAIPSSSNIPLKVVLPTTTLIQYLDIDSNVSLAGPLPNSIVGLILDWEKLEMLTGAYHSLTDLCIVVDPGECHNYQHSDKVALSSFEESSSFSLSIRFLPNLERLALVAGYDAPQMEPSVLAFLATVGKSVSGLYISGFSSHFVLAALALVPQLTECHISSVNDPSSINIPNPLKNNSCVTNDLRNKPLALLPPSFADRVLSTAAIHTPHLQSLWLNVTSVQMQYFQVIKIDSNPFA
ncbi:uncharacterized protein SAPINGB_P005147 [Magnusiomyces paraingens]|uniref:F-box domain-containing protein n=1 Tax=Magnusiomyces paraingens TaxID=2606893 RepID=A0A5E8BZL3_9ASCO|nr:uncharacterized protein SAPINGB_P005147 [Saprochaete ingens]VVT56552.1 unnamed protein product [Saprochaete ingens]